MGCDTLAYLSVEGIYEVMGYDRRDPIHPQFTDHCFTGEYPTRLRDLEGPAPPASSRSLPKQASEARVVAGLTRRPFRSPIDFNLGNGLDPRISLCSPEDDKDVWAGSYPAHWRHASTLGQARAICRFDCVAASAIKAA